MIDTAARLLSDARIHHARLPELPDDARPRTAEEAYEVQDAVVQRSLDHYGGSVVGYKIACTNPTAQRQLHVSAPFHGRLLSTFCLDSPARLDSSQLFMCVVEAEFGFRIGRDLPPETGPYAMDAVTDAVAAVIPSIEIVDSRFESWTTVGVSSLIADNACNAAWVKGAALENWRDIDLAAQPVSVTVNGRMVREGSGGAVMGSPLHALVWLSEQLNRRGAGLKAGQYVTTGVTTEVYMAERGDRIVADFGPVGAAELAVG